MLSPLPPKKNLILTRYNRCDHKGVAFTINCFHQKMYITDLVALLLLSSSTKGLALCLLSPSICTIGLL